MNFAILKMFHFGHLYDELDSHIWQKMKTFSPFLTSNAMRRLLT